MKYFNESITKASKIYAEQTVLRAAINLIPYVGGSFDILLSSSGQNFVAKRIESFIEELRKEISKLDDRKINHTFLKSEEGFDLIMKGFNSASRTRQKEKLKLYANIIKNALTIGKINNEDEPEFFLKIIEELSIKDLQAGLLLFDLRSGKIKIPEKNKAAQNGLSLSDSEILSIVFDDLDKDTLVSNFLRLERTGLIKERVGSYIGYGGGKYLINPLFDRLINFLELTSC